MTRRLGAKVAQLIRDIQEKYNQAYIFYRTGKLAYVSSKTWEKYDNQFSITQRMNKLKKLAMERAVEFNSTFSSSSAVLLDQAADFWKVMTSDPGDGEKRWARTDGKGMNLAIASAAQWLKRTRTQVSSFTQHGYTNAMTQIRKLFDQTGPGISEKSAMDTPRSRSVKSSGTVKKAEYAYPITNTQNTETKGQLQVQGGLVKRSAGKLLTLWKQLLHFTHNAAGKEDNCNVFSSPSSLSTKTSTSASLSVGEISSSSNNERITLLLTCILAVEIVKLLWAVYFQCFTCNKLCDE